MESVDPYPTIQTFDSKGGVFKFGTLSTLDALIIPEGALQEESNIGRKISWGWNDYYVDSVFPTLNGYRVTGFYFYPFSTKLSKTCTLNYAVSTQNPNINLSNVHIYKIDDAFEKYQEITNYSTYFDENENGDNYKIFEIPVNSFEYFYTLSVEIID